MSRAAGESPRIEFSPELKQWIAEHPKVRLGVDLAWPPFSFIGPDERHQGIDAEMLALFADATRGKGRARCDSGAVEQIAANLVTNALKFTPIGGTVRAFVEASDGTLRMAVEDTGPGIPAEERSQLFGKFARLTPQPTSAENSNGLGLAIVRLLARAMAGEVEFQECPGGGSRFVVTLPAVE